MTLRRRRESPANSSLKRRPGDRAVNPGGGDRRRKGLTGVFGRYKKGMTWWNLGRFCGVRARARFGQESRNSGKIPTPIGRLINDINGLCGKFRRIDTGSLFRPNGDWKGRIRGFFDLDQGIPHFCASPRTWRPRSSPTLDTIEGSLFDILQTAV